MTASKLQNDYQPHGPKIKTFYRLFNMTMIPDIFYFIYLEGNAVSEHVL